MKSDEKARTGLKFEWKKGSLNSNAIDAFEKNNIPWRYSHLGALECDYLNCGLFFKVEFENIENDVFEILIYGI